MEARSSQHRSYWKSTTHCGVFSYVHGAAGEEKRGSQPSNGESEKGNGGSQVDFLFFLVLLFKL